MAATPPLKRLNIQELSSEDDIRQVLVGQLNQFMESVSFALTNQLTVNENMAGGIKVVDLDGTWPAKISWSKGSPAAVIPCKLSRSDMADFTLSTGLSIRWDYSQSGQIQIQQITGVTPSASAKYKLSVLILMG